MKAFGFLLVSAFVVLAVAADAVRDALTTEFELESLEQCVARLPNAAVVDQKWEASVSDWYVPYMNQRDQIRVLNLVRTGAPEDKCLTVAPCRVLKIVNATIGYYSHCNGARSTVTWCPNENPKFQSGLADWTNTKHDGVRGWGGHSVIADTDNKSYKIVLKCWDDGTLGFVVFAARPRLPGPTQERIKAFVDSVGFSSFERVVTYHHYACPRL